MSPTSKLRMEMENSQPTEKDDSKIKQEMAIFEKIEIAKKEESVLNWWRHHENTLPTLARFARKVLAIPASSGKSERVFSNGGNFVTAKRTRLNPQKVQNLIVIKENKKMIQKYMSKLGAATIDVDGTRAFEKIKLVKKVGGIIEDSDKEPSSEDEYYEDED